MRILYNLCTVEEIRQKVRESGLIGVVVGRWVGKCEGEREVRGEAMRFVCGFYGMIGNKQEIRYLEENEGIKTIIQILRSEEVTLDEEIKK